MAENNASISDLQMAAQAQFSRNRMGGSRALRMARAPIWLLLISALIGIAATAMLNLSKGVIRDREILKARGIDGMGVIRKKWIDVNCHGKAVCQKTYILSYAFTPPLSSRQESGFGMTNLKNYYAVSVGSGVPIIYDPKAPSNHELNFGNQVRELPWGCETQECR